MTTLRLAVAGRYAERHTITQRLAEAGLAALPVVIMASWLDCAEECDADLTDDQAVSQAKINRAEIGAAHALIYVPSWKMDQYGDNWLPVWSPGRLIDVGIAFANRIPIIVVGEPEPSIYFRGELVTVCEWGNLQDTIRGALGL